MAKEKMRGRLPLALAVNSLGFLLGAGVGFLLAGWLVEGGLLVFEGLLPGWRRVAEEGGGSVTLGAPWWDVGRWPLLVWLLGFVSWGKWLVPVTFALRGFFFSYCVTGLCGSLRWSGLLLALLLFGLGGLISLPVFFALGARSWDRAMGIGEGLLISRRDIPPRDWLADGLALGILTILALLEYWLLPPLLRAILPVIS